MARMRKPETARLEISQGDWLLVKKHLTAGEHRAMLGNYYTAVKDNGVTVDRMFDPTRVGLAQIVAYLLDWSITDANGKPVVIADTSSEIIEAAVDALDPESFDEIRRAIAAHDAAMEKARVAEKNAMAGESPSLVTSPSLGTTAGDTSGLVN